MISNPMAHYSANDFNPIFKFIADLVESGKLPTGVFGVAQADRVVDVRAYGHRPDGRKVNTDDIYLLFSVTKPFIGLAIAQLWERGRLNLNHELKRYLPGFGSNRPDCVTLWHLLTHTSGIDQNVPTPLSNDMNEEEWHKLLANAPMQFTAGSFKLYNNLAFEYLAEIIRCTSGMDLEAYLQHELFAPLGMKSTSFDTYIRTPERVLMTERAGQLNIDRFMRSRVAAGGLLSNAHDVLTMGRMLLNDGTLNGSRIISPITLKAMTQPQTIGIPPTKPTDFVDTEVGLTWMLPRRSKSIIAGNVIADGGKGIYGHDGWGGCMFWMYPQQGVCFAFMTNLLDAGMHCDEVNRIHNVFASCL